MTVSTPGPRKPAHRYDCQYTRPQPKPAHRYDCQYTEPQQNLHTVKTVENCSTPSHRKTCTPLRLFSTVVHYRDGQSESIKSIEFCVLVQLPMVIRELKAKAFTKQGPEDAIKECVRKNPTLLQLSGCLIC